MLGSLTQYTHHIQGPATFNCFWSPWHFDLLIATYEKHWITERGTFLLLENFNCWVNVVRGERMRKDWLLKSCYHPTGWKKWRHPLILIFVDLFIDVSKRRWNISWTACIYLQSLVTSIEIGNLLWYSTIRYLIKQSQDKRKWTTKTNLAVTKMLNDVLVF